MVESTINFDLVFASLANATRRDVLDRVIQQSQTVGELADGFKNISFAGVAKHIDVLEHAQLVVKKRDGRYQIISANPKTLKATTIAMQRYMAMWESRFDALDKLLK